MDVVERRRAQACESAHGLEQRLLAHGRHEFDAVVEVPRHPVGRREEDVLLAAVVKAEDAAVFEEAADDLMIKANLKRLFTQRESLRQQNLPQLAANWRKSVFYQLDLKDVAAKYAAAQLPLPDALPDDAPSGLRMQDAMFRSEALRTTDRATADHYSAEAFGRLRDGMTEEVRQQTCLPRRTTFADQIVWARSAVRIDLAGGWTDTPPYSLMNGGNVVNIAIEMNGQQPLQVYVRPCPEPLIRCRSIDLGAAVTIETFEALRTYDAVGDPFSIPKAALALCGFLPEFCSETYPTLRHQLEIRKTIKD